MMNLLISILTILTISPLSLRATQEAPSQNHEASSASSESDPGRVPLGKKLQHRVQKTSRSERKKCKESAKQKGYCSEQMEALWRSEAARQSREEARQSREDAQSAEEPQQKGYHRQAISDCRQYEDIIQKSCYQQSQYIPTYFVKGISPAGKTMTLDNETIFEVAPSYAHIAARWLKNSKVIIRPNKTWFSWLSRYNFRLQNVTTQEAVEADLAQGPFVKYATFINVIDQYNGLLSLSDGSTWRIDPSQSVQLQQWQSGQAVLFGGNSAWYGAPHILINVNRNEYIPVSCY